MNFDKVINNMQEFQFKIEEYEMKSRNIDNAIHSIEKDIFKLEKKISNSKNEIEKHILSIEVLTMKGVLKKFEIEKNEVL